MMGFYFFLGAAVTRKLCVGVHGQLNVEKMDEC